MATAQLATNLGIVVFIASTEFDPGLLDLWTLVGLDEIFIKYSIVVVCFGFVSYLLLLYHIFFPLVTTLPMSMPLSVTP